MRVLLDEMLSPSLGRLVWGTEHAILSVRRMGWAGLKNGDLLRRAEAEHVNVFITMDRGVEFQQGTA